MTRFALLLLLGTLTLLVAGCATTGNGPRADQGRLAALLAQVESAPQDEQAQADFVVEWHRRGAPSEIAGRPVTVRVGPDLWTPGDFDILVAARNVKTGALSNRHRRDGVGAPLVGWRKNRGRTLEDRLSPPEGIARPVTAVVAFAPAAVTIELWKPGRVASVRGQPLAADFTAPWSYFLRHTSALGRLGIAGLLRAEGTGREPGLFLMEPYDPAKTPLLMVHGLLSTPLAWTDVTNDLRGDPAIRARYQVWHYYYPTGPPFLYSAMRLREDLARVRRQLDPGGRHPASRRTVIVAHSMGGLLSRTLVTDSGRAVWDTVFAVPPDELRAAPEDLAVVQSILEWRAAPHVERIIFVATPHRGSRMAVDFVGRFGDALTVLPERFRGVYARIDRDNPGALQPGFRRALATGRLTSIDTLSPGHRLLPVLNDLPVPHGARFHSIIGNRGRPGPLAESSDGVVPYASSHLAAAQSEVIVPTGHDAFRHPDAVAEIKRILTSP